MVIGVIIILYCCYFSYAFQNIVPVPVLSISWPGAAARRVVQKCGACHRGFRVC